MQGSEAHQSELKDSPMKMTQSSDLVQPLGLSKLQSQKRHCPCSGRGLPSSVPNPGDTSWGVALPLPTLPEASVCLQLPCRPLGADPGPRPGHSHPLSLPEHLLKRDGELRASPPADEEPEELSQIQRQRGAWTRTVGSCLLAQPSERATH